MGAIFGKTNHIKKMIRQESCVAGIGLILLCGWILVFINILATPRVESTPDWYNRFDLSSTKVDSQYNDDDHLMVLATSLMATEDPHNPIAELQRNTLYFMSTMPGILGVAFVDDAFWMKECQKFNLKCYDTFPKAPFGMPFIFGLLKTSMERHPGYPFYSYINGDILVENTIVDVLKKTRDDIRSGVLGDRVSLFTHRKNMFAEFPADLYSNHKESRDELFSIFNHRSVTYWDVAIDLFVFTPSVFPWTLMPNFVIGRTKYDNYIIQSLAHDPSQVMIDMSNTVAIVHQTVDGVRSGLRKQRSEKKSSISMLWNELVLSIAGIKDCCQDIWFAEQSTHVVVPTPAGVCVEPKLTRSYMEDDFQVNELDLLRKYIRKEDQRRCLFVVEGAVTGFATSLCSHSYYLCTNRKQCILSRKRVAACGLADTVTVICTEITRDKYTSQLVDYLEYYNAHFDTVVSLLPSGDGLIHFISLYQQKHPTPCKKPFLYFIRGFNRVQTRNSVLIDADVDVVELLEYKYFFDGPHFPEMGLAVYCQKGRKDQLA